MRLQIVLKDSSEKGQDIHTHKKLKFMVLRHHRFSGCSCVPGSVLNARDTVLAKQSRSYSLGSSLISGEKQANKHYIQTSALCITNHMT